MYSFRIYYRWHLAIVNLVFTLSYIHAICADELQTQQLTPIFEIPSEGDKNSLGLKIDTEKNKDQSLTNTLPLFYAVTSHTWPSGLIPIYQTRQKEGAVKLTRRLTHGRENFVEPLFFALPLSEDPHVGELSGRWSCEAKHHDGSIDFLHWEITMVDKSIVGRFDQDTDYRFAWLLEGRFEKPDIQLNVEYISAKYELIGKLSKNHLQGTWRHLENDDGGTWKAEPANHPNPFPDTYTTIPLFIIENEQTKNHTWQVGGQCPTTGFKLCLVWAPKNSSKNDRN